MSDTTDTDFDPAAFEAVFEKFNDDNASAPPEVLEDLSVPDPADTGVEDGDVGSGEDADTGIAAHVGDSEDDTPPPGDAVPAQDPLPSPSAEGPDTDWFAPLEARLGRTLDERERAAALGVTADLLAADQARQQAAWQALYGTPAAQVPAEPPAPAPNPLDDLDDLVDPEAAAILRQAMSPLQAQIEALTQAEQHRQAEYQQQQMAHRVNVIDNAGAAWREKAGVDDQTWDHLISAAQRHTPAFDAFAQQSGGDYGAATQRLLDYLYWTDEKLRDAEVQRRLAAERASLQEDYVRQTRAASVSTAGSTTAPVAAPATEESELLNAIAARMSDGVPGDISN